ncbi:MAG: alpha/beta hydrolase [Flavihumibacter sp.]|nr:alpha/beta hydrolase [Flavihumibacter sp.]
MRLLYWLVILFFSVNLVNGQQVIEVKLNAPGEDSLWSKLFIYKTDRPVLPHMILIIPGGGYSGLVIENEGHKVARWFWEKGINCAVLQYRIPKSNRSYSHVNIPFEDVKKSIQYLYQQSAILRFDSEKIGVMGFSAGGHLAAYSSNRINTEQGLPKISFQVLLYPVVGMSDELNHAGSRYKLLGSNPLPEHRIQFSNEKNLTLASPSSLLIHSIPDSIVHYQHSLAMFDALRKINKESELHLFSRGDHGFLLKQPYEEWLSIVIRWIRGI